MQTVRLGKTELQVSRIGFGGIPIQRLAEGDAVKVVRRCLDLGVNFLDTANAYTTSEARIGKAIAGRREQVILATKTGVKDKKTALEHLELSLKQLQTDYIDLWQFHNVSTEAAYEQILGPDGAMEAAQEALQSGKIRHLGVSSHSLDLALKMVPSGYFETVQFPLNFVTDEALSELLPLARQHDVGFIAMKPLAGGLLDNAALALKWLLQFEDVLPDPGIEQAAEIEEIVRIVEGPWELSAAERQEIERIRAEVGTRFCRRCQYCLPCPQGINITLMMTVRSFIKRFAANWFQENDFSKVIETAKTCIHCGQCEDRCPYHLPIREMLAENIVYYEQMVL
ncbi:aldo/keto reductase [Candidatus Vecturithrix granuli]|uniref:Aldo/keto reductase n=1 Tax=Vecturithrix granuli TaxID=1499967 RepID=A0A081CAT4_VECG1|nr:aldo/keto reductase [Candidatus Vecturithrix granuli]